MPNLARHLLRIPGSAAMAFSGIPVYCHRHPPPAIRRYRPMQRKLRILVDMDGVLADFERHLMNIYEQEAPHLPVLPECRRRGLNIDRQYELEFPDQPQAAEKLREIMVRQHFFRDLPPIAAAVNKVHALLDNPDYDVSICTSPLTHNAFCTSEKLEWLEKYFGKRFHRKVIMTNDKTVINADLLLDDKENIRGALEPSFTHILVRQVHNQNVSPFHRANILEDWDQLDSFIEDKAKKLQIG